MCIGANNRGEWSGTALETTPYRLKMDLTHSVRGSQYRVCIKHGGSSTPCQERNSSKVAPRHSGDWDPLREEYALEEVQPSLPAPRDQQVLNLSAGSFI